MPHRIKVTLDDETFAALDVLAQIRGQPRAKILGEWIAIAKPSILSLAGLLDAAMRGGQAEKHELIRFLESFNDDADQLLRRIDDRCSTCGSADAEPPSCNTGVPTVAAGGGDAV